MPRARVLSRSPDMLSALTITRTFSASSARQRLLRPSGELRSWPRVPVKVDGRELGLRHQVHRRDERRLRPVVDDARWRKLGRLARAGRTSVMPAGHSSPGWICTPPPRPPRPCRPPPCSLLAGGGDGCCATSSPASAAPRRSATIGTNDFMYQILLRTAAIPAWRHLPEPGIHLTAVLSTYRCC